MQAWFEQREEYAKEQESYPDETHLRKDDTHDDWEEDAILTLEEAPKTDTRAANLLSRYRNIREKTDFLKKVAKAAKEKATEQAEKAAVAALQRINPELQESPAPQPLTFTPSPVFIHRLRRRTSQDLAREAIGICREKYPNYDELPLHRRQEILDELAGNPESEENERYIKEWEEKYGPPKLRERKRETTPDSEVEEGEEQVSPSPSPRFGRTPQHTD